jgi:ketosteroid isomerase-like protein
MCLLAICMTGQSSAPRALDLPAPPGPVERAIEQVEQRREAALVRKDFGALEQIYDDDYTLITATGQFENRAQLLQRLKSGDLVVQAMERSEVKLRVYGDVAVQTSLDAFRMHDAGTPPEGRKRVTRIYLKRATGWRLAHVQDTLVAK